MSIFIFLKNCTMKYICLRRVLVIFLFSIVTGVTSESAEAQFVIKDVNVIPMTIPNKLIRNQMVVISDGKISYIGKSRPLFASEARAEVISGKGKYLMPGLADMHCHFPDSSKIRDYYIMNLMAGVTTLRSMKGQQLPVNFYKMKNFPAPKVYLSGLVSDKLKLSKAGFDSLVTTYKNQGLDFIKVFSITDSLSFENLMSSAKSQHMPVCGHFLKKIGIEALIRTKYNSIEHLGGQEDAYNQGVVNYISTLTLMRESGISHCPTLDWYRVSYGLQDLTELDKRAGLNVVSDSIKAVWKQAYQKQLSDKGSEKVRKQKDWYNNLWRTQAQIIKKMCDNGINIIIGLDAGGEFSVPGYSMLEEMKLLSDAGLANYDILRCATINAARSMKETKLWGTVETGKEANLILLNANPLTNLSSISEPYGVFVKSGYHKVADLKEFLGRR